MAEEQRHDADGFAARAGLRLRRDVSVVAAAAGAAVTLVDEVDAERLAVRRRRGDGDGGAVLGESGVVMGLLGAPGVIAEPVSRRLA